MPFRVLWWSRAVSFAGDGIGRTALVLYATTHGATAVSLVLLAIALPRFLGPVAGALADRLDQRRLMAVCELGQAAVFALLAVFLPPLPVLLAFVLLGGGFATAFVPAGRSAVPALVPEAGLGRANALLGMAFNIQLAVGPTVGGLAVELGGARVAFAVNALTFVVSALILTRLPALTPTGVHTGLWAETVAGLRFVATTPGPRALVVSLFLVVSFAAIDNVALVFLVTGLGGSPADFGLTQAAYGVGMLAASALLGFVLGTRSAAALLIGGIGLVSTGAIATAFLPTLVAVAVAQAVGGMGNGTENVATDTLVQRITPRHLLGRAFGAVATAAQLGSAVAYVAAGPLIGLVGPAGAFLVGGIGTGLALLVALPALRTHTRDDRSRAAAAAERHPAR
ncbi:MFS transporter [Actinophytocola algeriensis]|uniref:MFS family permease n=1 Tax=Actinophytocola algeriensis TaxID=1768010 RepID=A0A7W7Q5K0_9PSEU|nr:MFS transporter [Actinophytocola algeriensis]MBB4907490.1 MFS family permease [Actinophytocola algeriensis]MBE1479520.1 MFS family permease [Actinophytocola algeriensis]